ncbi:hypothetical protein JQN47_27375, partial [Escherichia coli]|nr:hypothetical protein [Escherichia coli]
IKLGFGGSHVKRKTQEHRGSCLTCRNCETSCRSGGRYHNLLVICRDMVEQKVKLVLTVRMLLDVLR